MAAPLTSLSARSLVASTLLGTHPPELPGRLLVALARRFGIAEGTTRVALSRMVDRGELTNTGGTYTLAGHLLQRQLRQDTSRHDQRRPWDGAWSVAVVTGVGGEPSRRAARRVSLSALKLAELREGVWARPDNLDPQRLVAEPARTADDVLWGQATFEVDQPALAASLWDLDAWADRACALVEQMAAAVDLLDEDDAAALASGFELSAAVLRHFVADPDLPGELLPEHWPGTELRTAYDAFDAGYRRALRRFFRSIA